MIKAVTGKSKHYAFLPAYRHGYPRNKSGEEEVQGDFKEALKSADKRLEDRLKEAYT